MALADETLAENDPNHVPEHIILAVGHNLNETHRALTTAAHGGIVAATDPRLTDQRVPTDGSVTNAKVATTAAIAKSKLAPLDIGDSDVASISPSKVAGTAVTTGDARLSDTRTPADGSVTNTKVATNAAIAKTKLAPLDIVDADVNTISPSKVTGTAVVTTDTRLSDNRIPINGSVTDAKVASTAAIQKSKLAPLAIVDADVDTISPSKVNGTAVITSDSRLSDARVPTNSSVTDAKVATGAAIAKAKLAPLAIVDADVSAISPSKVTGTAVVTSDARLSDARNLLSPTGPVSFNGQRITNVGMPTQATDAASKSYADSLAQGIKVLESVRAATTANITLSGTQTIDGVAVVAGNRVLAKNQTTASANGIYVVAAGAWARSTDADTDAEVVSGIQTYVNEGTTNARSTWTLITPNPITVGTTALTFTQSGGTSDVLAGDGLSKMGNTISVPSGGITAAMVAADVATQAELDTHTALTTTAHGGIVASSDARLTDTRTPTDGTVTDAKVAAGAAIAKSKLAALAIVDADVSTLSPSKITGTAVVTADSRLSDQRVPTNDSVTDVKVAAAAAIAQSKIANLTTDLAAKETPAGAQAKVDAHTALTTTAHGGIVSSGDSRLTDTRTPTDASVTDAKVAAGAAIAESKLALASDAAAGTASRRTLGTGATQAAAGNDTRLSDTRTPTDGTVTTAKIANGAVTAAKVAADVATQAELDAHALTAHGASLTVQEEGSALTTSASTLNFVGPNVTAAGTGATKTITVLNYKIREASFPGPVAPVVGDVPIIFPRAATITKVEARCSRSPGGTAIIADWRRGTLATAADTPYSSLPSLYASNPAGRPSIAPGTNFDAGDLPGSAALAAGDFLVPELAQVGLSNEQSMRGVASTNSGTVSVSSFSIPIPTGVVAGDTLFTIIEIGGATASPLPLGLPTGWVQDEEIHDTTAVSPTVPTIWKVQISREAAASGNGGTVTFANGGRPFVATTIAMIGTPRGAGYADINEGRYYDTAVANPKAGPDADIAATADSAVFAFFGYRVNAGAAGTTATASIAAPPAGSGFTEIAESCTTRVDATNFGLTVWHRPSVPASTVLTGAQRTATYTTGSYRSLTRVVGMKAAGAQPGAGVSLLVEYVDA